MDEKLNNQLKKLEEKFKNSGQDMNSYLDGLLYDRYLTYWDYIHLDTLLSLQIPRTYFPDEEIFIGYHQITELYFKLIIHELKQIIDDKLQQADFFTKKLEHQTPLLQLSPWHGLGFLLRTLWFLSCPLKAP